MKQVGTGQEITQIMRQIQKHLLFCAHTPQSLSHSIVIHTSWREVRLEILACLQVFDQQGKQRKQK